MAVFTAIGAFLGAGAATAFTVGAAAIGAAATVGSVAIQAKAAKAQRRAAATQAQMQREQAARQRRSSIRAALIQRAQLANVAAVTGASGSTAAQGGLASLSSQLGANLGFGSMMSGLGEQYTSLTQQAARLQGAGQLVGAIGSAGFDIAPMPFTQSGQAILSGLRGNQ